MHPPAIRRRSARATLLAGCLLFVVAPFARSGGLPYPTGANSTEAQARAYAASIASDPDSLWFKSGKAPDRQQHLTDAFVVGPGGVNIAAFSDDGVNVYVTDLTDFLNQTGAYQSKLALPGLGKGQALPNIGESFHKLDYNFVAGHIYRIMVFYNNIVYTGDGDIDGASADRLRRNRQSSCRRSAEALARRGR